MFESHGMPNETKYSTKKNFSPGNFFISNINNIQTQRIKSFYYKISYIYNKLFIEKFYKIIKVFINLIQKYKKRFYKKRKKNKFKSYIQMLDGKSNKRKFTKNSLVLKKFVKEEPG